MSEKGGDLLIGDFGHEVFDELSEFPVLNFTVVVLVVRLQLAL